MHILMIWRYWLQMKLTASWSSGDISKYESWFNDMHCSFWVIRICFIMREFGDE